MATSSKVMFNLETLKAKALENIEFKIKQKQRELETLGSTESLTERLKQWRARQETRISELMRSLDEIGDYQLAKFKIDEIPTVDRYDVRRAEQELARLERLQADVIAKSDSIVADEQGNVSLTKTQLTEFFGL